MLVLAPDPRLGVAPERVARVRALLDAAGGVVGYTDDAGVPGVVVALPGGASGALDALVLRPDGVLGLVPVPVRESATVGAGADGSTPDAGGEIDSGQEERAGALELDRLLGLPEPACAAPRRLLSGLPGGAGDGAPVEETLAALTAPVGSFRVVGVADVRRLLEAFRLHDHIPEDTELAALGFLAGTASPSVPLPSIPLPAPPAGVPNGTGDGSRPGAVAVVADPPAIPEARASSSRFPTPPSPPPVPPSPVPPATLTSTSEPWHPSSPSTSALSHPSSPSTPALSHPSNPSTPGLSHPSSPSTAVPSSPSSAGGSLPPVPSTSPLPVVRSTTARAGDPRPGLPATGRLRAVRSPRRGARGTGRPWFRLPTHAPGWLTGYRGLALAAVVAFLVALVLALLTGQVATSNRSARSAPDPASTRAVDGTTFTRAVTTTETTCDGHAYGLASQFLRERPCRQLARALWTATVDGRSVVVSVASVQMADTAAAAALKSLIDSPGTGNVADLLREGRGYPGSPDRLTGAGYGSALLGDRVVLAEADRVEGVTMTEQDLDRLSRTGLALG